MAAAYAHLGMWPVGTKTGMIVDMHHQYAPLLAQLRDRLLQLCGGIAAPAWPELSYYTAAVHLKHAGR